MTRDDIMRMAWQAFSDPAKEDAWRNGFWTVTQEELEDFAALVADAEREACARAAAIALLGADKSLADRVVNAIRSRGQRE